MKRTKKSAIGAAGLAAALLISGAFAYLSDHDNAINMFSFTDEDGNQSIDIELSETNWKEQDGKNVKYGTPVAKNPVATNISTAENAHDMYAFATVILPAKAVAVQDATGALVDTNGNAITDLAEAGFEYKIANNVSANDAAKVVDETEILGVYKDAACATPYEFGEIIPDDAHVYFKLSGTSKFDETAAAGNVTKVMKEDDTETEADESTEVDYYVLNDTFDANTGVSVILGHQFMAKVEKIVGDGAKEIPVRELYATELADNDDTDGSNANRAINKAGQWTAFSSDADDIDSEYDADDDDVADGYAFVSKETNEASATLKKNQAINVFARSAYNNAELEGPVEGHWIEITNAVSDPTVYIDASGRIYSAHVYYYSKPLAKGESTLPVFDYVEVINTAADQIQETDDMNIYVETYGIQTDGITEDVIPAGKAEDSAEAGAAIWETMTNSENQEAFDIFAVVKKTAPANAASQFVAE